VKKPKDQEWKSWIDQQIRQAQEQGEFDELPGKGKPLDLTPNPYAQERELAFKILKNAGYAPEWIELDKAIRGKLERARAVLARRWEQHRVWQNKVGKRANSRAQAEWQQAQAGWQKVIADFETEIQAINIEIAELNLKVPSLRFQRPKIDVARELASLEKE
jgi:DnaJ family protein C protein 28